MAFVVVYDACVLYPAPLRDLLMRLAVKGLVRARWTEQILDECFRNILAKRPDLNASSLQRTRDLMNQSIRDVMVTGHEGLISSLELPDRDDRHVLAAAIRAGAQVIVTANLSDFPDHKLEAYSVEAQHPDEFVLHLLDLAPVWSARRSPSRLPRSRTRPVPLPTCSTRFATTVLCKRSHGFGSCSEPEQRRRCHQPGDGVQASCIRSPSATPRLSRRAFVHDPAKDR